MILKNKIFIYLLVIFFAVFAGSGIFLGANHDKTTKKEATPTPTGNLAVIKQENMDIPTVIPSQGSMALATGVPGARFALTSGQISVDLIADSNGKNIGGYDIILPIDTKNFEFVSAVTDIPDFKIYSNIKGNYVTITALQSLSNQAVIFKGTKLATLNFRPLKTGKFSLSLSSSTDKYFTDLVTNKTEVLYPALRGLTVEVY